MPMATRRNTTSRRVVLGGGAAAMALAAVPIAEIAAAHPDAELLRLVAAFRANEAESKALIEAAERLPVSDPRHEAAWQKQWSELTPRFHELKWQIATTPARTPAGLRAKATIALTMVCPEMDGLPSGDDALGASVLHDVLGLPPVSRSEEEGDA